MNKSSFSFSGKSQSLVICDKIVKKFGGSIGLKSQGDSGSHTAFCVGLKSDVDNARLWQHWQVIDLYNKKIRKKENKWIRIN